MANQVFVRLANGAAQDNAKIAAVYRRVVLLQRSKKNAIMI